MRRKDRIQWYQEFCKSMKVKGNEKPHEERNGTVVVDGRDRVSAVQRERNEDFANIRRIGGTSVEDSASETRRSRSIVVEIV